jgi:hypothetical protein
MGSTQQSLNPEEEHETEHEDVPEVGASSPQGKKKKQVESSVQGVQCAQAELEIVMPQIPEGVKADDEMVGGVNTMKYSDHDVADAVKFPDLATKLHGVQRRGPIRCTTVGTCAVDFGTLQHRDHEPVRHTTFWAW